MTNTSARSQSDFVNTPRGQRAIMNPQLFWEQTQKNVIPLQSQSIPSAVVGERMTFRVPNRGIAALLRLHFDLSTVVASSGTHTLLEGFPEKWVKSVTVRANGTEIVSGASGPQLKALSDVLHKNPDDSGSVNGSSAIASGSDGTKSVDFTLDVPLCADYGTLMGAVFAESDDTYLEVDIQFESQANVATLSTTTWATTGTVRPSLVTYDVPHMAVQGGGDAIILPDLTHVAQIRAQKHFCSGAGENIARITPTRGRLMRLIFGQYDESALGWVDPLTLTSVKLRYGANQLLREYNPTRALIHENAYNYDGKIGAADLCAIDFMNENPLRDSMSPADAIEMELVLDSTGLTVASADYVHTLEQIIVPGDMLAANVAR